MDIILTMDFASYRRGTARKTCLFEVRVLETLFESMTRVGAAWLAAHKGAPLLYESGVEYQREGLPERWYDIPSILKRGSDDCEGLSIFLAAECRVRAPNSLGPDLRPMACVVLKQIKRNMFHAVVKDKATGQIFDPSKRLGM